LIVLFGGVQARSPAQELNSRGSSEASQPGVESQSPPRKRALLVGISKYDRHRGLSPKGHPIDWWDLACDPDLAAFKEVLRDRFAFSDQDILLLPNEKATRDGIISAFRQQLIEGAKPGDVLHFHFSGHGQPVVDDNGDEFDGMDETLIPYDYKTQDARDGAVTNLRDDTIGELLGELQEQMSVGGKFRGSITVTLDCCFSGTATRGAPPAGRLVRRGRGWMEDIDGDPPGLAERGQVDGGTGLLSLSEGAKQKYVLMTASSYRQVASQFPDPKRGQMGAFTSFLVREMEQATPRTTYQSLFEKVDYKLRATISDQNPQIEGAADTLLYAGTAVPREAYVVVRQVEGDVLTLPVGEVHMVRTESVFHVYKANGDVKDPADKIAEASVTETRGASCEARLAEPYRGKLSRNELGAARAVEVERGYGDEEPLRVLLVDGVPAHFAAEVAKVKVATTHGVTQDDFDVRIRPHPDNPAELTLERKAAAFAYLNRNAEDVARRLHDALWNAWRTRALLRLSNPDGGSLVQVDLRVVPAEVKFNSQGRVLSAKRREDFDNEKDQAIAKFEDGDYVMLEVRNRSERRNAYVTILHFQPDGSVYCLFPDERGAGEEINRFKPDPDKWFSLGKQYVFQAAALRDKDDQLLDIPAVETFKLIATREPSNYSRLLPTRRVPQRGTDAVRREVMQHTGRGDAAGGKRPNYDLARLLGAVSLGEDPDPDNKQRSQLLQAVVTDWNTAAVKVETWPPVKKDIPR